MSWNTLFTRQRARFASHRLDTSGDDTGSLPSPIAGTNESPSPPTNHADSLFGRNDRPAVDVERGVVSNAAATATVVHPTANPEDNHENDTPTSRNSRTAVAAGGGDDQGSSAESSESSQGDTFDMPVVFSRPRLSLADLEEERELSRRRSSACVMFFIFILFRLWMEAIQSGNFGLLMICLLGTSWLARWIRYNREQEDELDRRIAAHLAESPTLDRHDLRMLSFQAQLALAIMESQRQMMAAGGHDSHNTPGVTNEAKAKWEEVTFQAAGSSSSLSTSETAKKKGYGSLPAHDKTEMIQKSVELNDNDDEPHCSICLSEYYDGDKLIKLPCGHLYHSECITSWTSNHVKCPLCNFDLESVVESRR